MLRKQRSQELGLQLREISRDSLRKKTQRAEKVYKFIERVGLDKIKYIKSYSATFILEFTNKQIQKVINYEISSEKLFMIIDNNVTEISEILYSKKICLRILHNLYLKLLQLRKIMIILWILRRKISVVIRY